MAALCHAYSTTEDSSAKPIGRYPVPNKKDMPYDIVELMEEVERKTGFLPNVFKALSHPPDEFRAFFAYYNVIMNKETGQLSKADKELIIVATSAANRCPYCVIAHGALHRIYSKQPELADQVAVNWELAELGARERAMLEFALAVCRADSITEQRFARLAAHGFDREDAWDMGAVAAFFAMANRLAHCLALRPNAEFHALGRGRAAPAPPPGLVTGGRASRGEGARRRRGAGRGAAGAARRGMSAEPEPEPPRSAAAPSGPGPPPPPPPLGAMEPPAAGPGLFGWLRGRCLGRSAAVDPARDSFRAMTALYGSIQPADSVYLSTRTHGAVFNLEYSPDGSVLTVACEQTEVLLFDPISSKHIKTLSEAHEDCVNNIRFLDNRLFATCSDDTTIALWDLRKLNTKVCTLHGHTSWVKNIEYDTNTRLLVTSGFDGNVIIWDTNRCTEDGCPHKKFFHTRFLMRMRLTPDCSKMLISTSSGYLLILHDLDLNKSLEVGSYPILRARRTTSSSEITSSSSSAPRSVGSPCHQNDSGLLSEKQMSRSSQREGGSPRNSLEVLTPEVPGERDRGNCITSLQLHPKGWATLLRCSSNTDDQEWTCVYEFQEGAPVRPVSPRCSLRLTHCIEEANVGRGYIKELCFSPDGRMISSPHGFGIRLLGFDAYCSELVDCLPKEAGPLKEIRSLYSHNDVVLTTKFSPTHCQIASGCLSGRVSLYQPKF